ncbi:EAL domain-containing protein [[Phormidium] sp. ETS-05]|uniref:EAL domain-containing protein n=1 Tax=[Phormidium] sp. ETS-05 TaxID=222819 RepID=UPI0018EF08D0|nr:EAL domain-containing protein [[Phormidium] sp. ETS-05]
MELLVSPPRPLSEELRQLIIQPPDEATSMYLVGFGFQPVPALPQLYYRQVTPPQLVAIFAKLSETLDETIQGAARFLLTSKPLDAGELLLEFLRAQPLLAFTKSVKYAWFYRILIRLGLFFKYQPIFDLASGEVAAYECLARAKDEEGQCISGGQLIDAAISTQLTCEFDELARTTCLAEIAGMQAQQKFFINLIPNAIVHNPHSLEQNLQQILELGLQPEQIVFELTEVEVLSQTPELLQQIQRLRNWGFGIAVDDLCGCVSVDHYLMEFRPDIIKLDRRLVHGSSKFTLKQTLIESLLSSAHREGILVLAEGLEALEDIEFCRNLGIDYGQGFGLALPETSLQQTPLNYPALLPSAC